MTREIQLTKGKVAIVDDEDFALVSRWRWAYIPSYKNQGSGYAMRITRDAGSRKSRAVYMHRFIMNSKPGQETDHVDRNGLNNTRANLRLCSHGENTRNRRDGRGHSRYKGVYVATHNPKKWQAGITSKGKRYYLGTYDDEISAARAYDAAAKLHHGEYAGLNFPAECDIDP